MTWNKKLILKKSAIVFAGAALGYAYYYFIGCSSGSCPITSNPYISTFYGALIAFILVFPTKKKANDGTEKNNQTN